MSFEPVIGLEIHAQLLTDTKIFCGCSTRFGAPPNTNVCPVCLGYPGSLPVLNQRAVELATRAALALDCAVQTTSVFARKNYFYPDLPKGYQISQYERPLAIDGRLVRAAEQGDVTAIQIIRVHMEEDAGKSLHEGFDDSAHRTYMDFNRTGVPLIEIVTGPDLRSAEDASECFGLFREILVTIGVSDGNMEEGSLRCDANVSVRPTGQSDLGVKTEIKNLNSFRYVQKALDFEVDRQIRVLTEGGTIEQETRLWDASGGRTLSMRSKEEAHDYRYFPEPDLPPLELDPAWIETVREALPELPEARKRRLVAEYGLSTYDAAEITHLARGAAVYFEAVVEAGASPKPSANWILGELARKLNEIGGDDIGPVAERLPPKRLAALLGLVERSAISGATAKDVFEKAYETGRSPEEIVESEGLSQIADEAALLAIAKEVIAGHPGPVAQYRGGKVTTIGFLVGQVMRATGGKANPKLVNVILRRELDG